MMLKNLSKETFAKNREDFVRKNLSRQGLNESTVKFMLTKEKIDESLYLIRENIPDLVQELYKLKNLLVQKYKDGERATPLESLDEFLKDILEEKIERNLKSKKF